MRKRLRSCAAVLFSCMLMTALAGCSGAQYEKVNEELAGVAESEDTIVLGEGSIEVPVILIDPETDERNTSDLTENGAADTMTEIPPEAEEAGISLLFGGDVLLSSHVLQAYQKAGGINGVLDSGYLDEIRRADFFMVNQEFPFSDRGTAAADKTYTFRLAPEYVKVFQEMGIDGVTLANNHALDFGRDAMLDSVDILDRAGIKHTGAGADLDAAKQAVIFEQDQFRIGIIGATRVIPVADWAAGKGHPGMLSTYDPTVLLAEIRTLRETCDYVVVLVHWGIERDEKPQNYQRQLGQQYIDAGADLVVGSHPHVLQGIEYYKGKPIVYSLGNFVFGSSIPKTALLKVVFTEGKDQDPPVLRILPGTSGAGYTRRLTDPAKLQEFYRYLESISFDVSFGEDGIITAGS